MKTTSDAPAASIEWIELDIAEIQYRFPEASFDATPRHAPADVSAPGTRRPSWESELRDAITEAEAIMAHGAALS
ncbi:MAG: hypothetical protein OEV36_11060 [Myxococcales bacterium]|nr:hypothetical protein [Myxococcales bacterium]